MNDLAYMKIALELAVKGAGYTSPNPMVGAVVVKEGKIIGKGWHEKVGGPHAEVNAINSADTSLEGADIYVTLEPCNHTGRTPPCTKMILEAGIKRVVVAMDDPNPDVAGGGNTFLRENGLEVISGICEAEAIKLNEAFIKYITEKKPFLTAKCACTLDGRIATRTGDAKWVTGEASRRYVHQMRHEMDAIMVGIGTVMADDPMLTARLEGIDIRHPVRVILDSKLSVPINAKVLGNDAKTIVVTGPDAFGERKAEIEDKGVNVLEVPLKNNRIDLGQLMKKLGEQGIMSILLEGGSSVMASALKADIVDKAMFFYAPKILGGDDGIPVCSGPGPKLMRDSLRLINISSRRFDDDILIEGYIDRG
ncbi:MAG: bifunctional diaminohydroxyphosphoribosylaminopyrimidine deaminase/5-amino-6-(5-phosphoribosylamino)uracil reductase RibD [Desulfobacterales bacterium]|nr:bifunctional diaminohydroxyphosphoribosylaminopyrimidine deaminase/5-amino-6-(5-phosphoribosylamino)uracil reductase RibD [Desulfobacterales bacterium]